MAMSGLLSMLRLLRCSRSVVKGGQFEVIVAVGPEAMGRIVGSAVGSCVERVLAAGAVAFRSCRAVCCVLCAVRVYVVSCVRYGALSGLWRWGQLWVLKHPLCSMVHPLRRAMAVMYRRRVLLWEHCVL